MKKVFSVKKFEKNMSRIYNEKQIEESKIIWANEVDGLTLEEIEKKYGYLINDDWMIEVEEEGE